MALYLIVVQAHFIMNNVFEGMIWFFLPVSLVICNDIFAYVCGITFGRTQLIKLSPKKTVEGFVGAWILTVIFGVGMTNVLMRYKYFICPVNVSLTHSQSIYLLILNRISERISGLVYNVHQTRSSILIPTNYQFGSHTSNHSLWHLCKVIFLYLQLSHHLSHHLEVSSHPDSRELSRSRISVIQSQDMVE